MSPASFRLIRHWLECCNATHQKCIVPNYAVPTRLIEIDASDVRICYSKQLPTPPHYVTLSHCWGGLKLFNLTKDNLRSMQDKIPQQKLCLTFRHAIGITRLLGFKYLWIDSLCIVQDDELDWRQEAAKMGSVYGCSSLNIAAASATNGSFGCFYNRKEQVLRCVRGVRVRVDGALHIVHEESSYYRSSITSSPLATRSWVLQERVLAPRVIWFSEQQLFWECRESLACETFQVQLPDFYGQYQPSNRGIDTLSKRWPSLVTKYTTGKLTRDSDKLVAISGLAQKAQQETGDDYVWGLWRRDLEAQLCWTLKDKSKGSYAGPLQSRAPSWSWASVNGPINLPIGIGWSASQIYGKILIRVVNVTTAPIANFPLEDGESKTLRLVRGPLFSAREVSGPEERDPQVLLAETLIRVSWIGYWDVPSDKSEEPRDPFYCLPVMRSETMVAAYNNRCEGLILKKTDNGMRGQFKRLGTYRVSGSSDAVRAMEDPKSMMQESMWESYGGLDTLGRRQYTITLL